VIKYIYDRSNKTLIYSCSKTGRNMYVRNDVLEIRPYRGCRPRILGRHAEYFGSGAMCHEILFANGDLLETHNVEFSGPRETVRPYLGEW